MMVKTDASLFLCVCVCIPTLQALELGFISQQDYQLLKDYFMEGKLKVIRKQRQQQELVYQLAAGHMGLAASGIPYNGTGARGHMDAQVSVEFLLFSSSLLLPFSLSHSPRDVK